MTVKLADLKNLCLVQHSCISQVLANFVLKFPNFRYHGSRGWTDVNFNGTGKLLDRETPCLVQRSWLCVLY